MQALESGPAPAMAMAMVLPGVLAQGALVAGLALEELGIGQQPIEQDRERVGLHESNRE